MEVKPVVDAEITSLVELRGAVVDTTLVEEAEGCAFELDRRLVVEMESEIVEEMA